MALKFHAGQIEVQTEANSRPAADMLAVRTAVRNERMLSFYAAADLLVLATADDAGALRFKALSGDAPLLSPGDGETLLLHDGAAGLRDGSQAGAIAIDLRRQRRARANGLIRLDGGRVFLHAAEELVNCRKYIAPSVALESGFHCGPRMRVTVPNRRPANRSRARSRRDHIPRFGKSRGQARRLAQGWPCRLHGIRPGDGRPDLARADRQRHVQERRQRPRYGTVSVLALDLETGDGYELTGRGEYRTELRYAEPRDSGLWPSAQDFPTQGVMTVRIETASQLQGMILPRRRIEGEGKVTACSPVEAQAPR